MSSTDHGTGPDSGGFTQLYRYSVGTLRVDEAKGTVEVDGATVPVSPTPLRLLLCLLRHRNNVAGDEALLGEVWPERLSIDDSLVHQTARRLREQLGAAEIYIGVVPGQGYHIRGSIEAVAVGVVPHHSLAFEPGQVVPFRPDQVFERMLGGSRFRAVWLTKLSESDQHRVCKFAATSDELSRLKREKTIYDLIVAALPNHDQFAELLSINFDQAPYFIECGFGGEDLLGWEAHEGLLRKWSLEQRINLFIQIASAVETLHQQIPAVHGDLKPANILIQANGEGWRIKLTDFGSGRPLSKQRLAELGVSEIGSTLAPGLGGKYFGGTWFYLAPELREGGRPTPASDIFALGVILYQLIVGDLRQTMDTSWAENIPDPHLVEDVRAATHSQLKHRTESVSKLIRQVSTLNERRRQYEEAAQLAQFARANAESLRRQKARRPWVITAFAGLTVGLSASFWQYRNAVGSAAEAKLEATKAKALSEFLIRDVLEAADVTSVGPTKSLVVSDMLARASVQARTRFSGLPDSEWRIRMELAELYFRISDFGRAQAEYEAAAKLFGSGQRHIEANYGAARSLIAQSKLDEADRLIATANSQWNAADESKLPSVALIAAKVRAQAHSMRQQYPMALAQAQSAVRLADQTAPYDLIGRFIARRMLAEMQMRAGDLKAAGVTIDQMNQAPFAPESVGEVTFARAQIQRARLANLENRLQDSINYLAVARDTITRRLGPNEYTLGSIHEELGRAMLYFDRYSEAEREYTEAVRIFTNSVGRDHQQTRVNTLNLALVYLSLGEPARTLAVLNENRPWFVEKMGGQIVQLIDFFRARALLDLGRTDKVADILRNLEADQLNAVSGTSYTGAALQAEHVRLAVLRGNKEAAEGLSHLVAEMKKGGASEGELQRYVKLYRR